VKVKWYAPRKCWKLIVPTRLTGTGKAQRLFFSTKQAGEAEARARLAGSARPPITPGEDAALTLARNAGLSPEQYLDAVRLYQRQVLNVTKTATLEEAVQAFLQHQAHERRAARTIGTDRALYRAKLIPGLGCTTPMTEVTLKRIDACIHAFPPGTTRQTFYSRAKKFFTWAFRQGYTATDLMAEAKSKDRYAENKEILRVYDYRRLLFVAAGLEPIHPGEAPTTRYQRLLPRYVLGGLAGMRNCEILRDNPAEHVIEWQDIFWGKDLIRVRHEVAKKTKAANRLRYVELTPAAKEWLALVQQPSGPMLALSASYFGILHRELKKALNVKVEDNALRNSYASYRQTIDSPGAVAKAMGDLESTIKKWYVETLEPGDGHAWFDVRPTMDRNVIPMVAVA
jgi:hypothetical protein